MKLELQQIVAIANWWYPVLIQHADNSAKTFNILNLYERLQTHLAAMSIDDSDMVLHVGENSSLPCDSEFAQVILNAALFAHLTVSDFPLGAAMMIHAYVKISGRKSLNEPFEEIPHAPEWYNLNFFEEIWLGIDHS